jgi:hypothetical protein
MVRQHDVAVKHSYTFLDDPEEVRDYVAKGRLVELATTPNYELWNGVSFPFVRPETKAFVERFAADFRQNCGTPMVVTSATRPKSMQPRNAHDLSVHPTGMAIDLRVPREPKCREWAEEALLALEKDGVLDVTRERRPPHLHIAIFPAAVPGYLAKAGPAPTFPGDPAPAAAQAPVAAAPAASPAPRPAAQGDAAPSVEQAETEPGSMAAVLAGLAVLLGLPLALFFWLRRRRTHRPDAEPVAAAAPAQVDAAPAPRATRPLEIRVERRDRAA